jgi:hypothetical protein
LPTPRSALAWSHCWLPSGLLYPLALMAGGCGAAGSDGLRQHAVWRRAGCDPADDAEHDAGTSDGDHLFVINIGMGPPTVVAVLSDHVFHDEMHCTIRC